MADKDTRGPKVAPRWQVIENVVAILEHVRGKVPGMVVIQKAQVPVYHDPSRVREIDILVRYPVGDRVFSLGIEVKAHGRPLIVGEMGQILDLWRDVRLDRFAVVSASGFSEDATEKAAREKVELVTLEEFKRSSFWQHEPEMLVIHRHCDPVTAEFRYRDADIDQSLQQALGALLSRGLTPGDASLQNDSGASPLSDFVARCGAEALGTLPQDSQPKHGDMFEVRIDMRNHREVGSVIRTNEHTFPLPETIVATFQMREVKESVPERRFRVRGVELLASEHYFGNDSAQMTIVAEPQADGTRKIVAITLSPARPKDVKVGREP